MGISWLTQPVRGVVLRLRMICKNDRGGGNIASAVGRVIVIDVGGLVLDVIVGEHNLPSAYLSLRLDLGI